MIYIHQVMVTLLTGASAAVSTGAKANFSAKSRSEFLSAMKSANLDSHLSRKDLPNDQTPSFETFVGYINGNSDKSRSLRNKMLAKAKYVPPKEIKEREARELEQNYVNSKYNYNNANTGSSFYTTNGGGNSNSYSVASGTWNNAFGFDATQYSFSYQRCAEVRQFDDALAAQEDSTNVFATKHFAVFRFCPSQTCEGMTEEEIEAEREAEYQEYLKNLNAQKAQYQAATYAQYKNDNSYVPASQYVKQQAAAAQAAGVSYEPPAWYFDKRVIGGANGSGCSSNYGEYMLELEDYLEIMSEYHAERFAVYCSYCEKCMYNAYNKWLNAQGRELKQENWKEDFERHLGEDDRELKDINYYAVCPEYDTCKHYKNLCKAGFDSSIEKYFTCTKVERSNGRDAYIGPHCSDDGTTVTLGVYSDETCNEYIGKGVNINNYLGYQLDKSALEGYVTGSLARDVIPDDYFEKYWSDELQAYYDPQEQLCIPCAASMQIYQNKGNIYQQGSGNDYRNSKKQYGDKVNGLCLKLYMASARCDKHYQSYSSKDKNSKISNYLNRMELSCDFIESVVMGNYNEMGFPIIDNSHYDSANGGNLFTSAMFYEEYGQYVREVSGLQIFGLCASILACVILGIWSIALTRSMAGAKTPWRPRRTIHTDSLPADEYNKRQDSGIVRGRSGAVINSYYMS